MAHIWWLPVELSYSETQCVLSITHNEALERMHYSIITRESEIGCSHDHILTILMVYTLLGASQSLIHLFLKKDLSMVII